MSVNASGYAVWLDPDIGDCCRLDRMCFAPTLEFQGNVVIRIFLEGHGQGDDLIDWQMV